MDDQQTRARQFRALHLPGEPLILVNAWDALSARIVAAAGARAVAPPAPGRRGVAAPRRDALA
ncbi:isocitrate lyase/phosphoenolpyruvate mutase family protein, partial [Micromonospora provocatoris]